jgi:CRISPR-associated exonuclease Cas4
MMGDRDYRSLIKNAIDSLGQELDVQIDAADHSTIHLEEAIGCLRRAYYDRRDPLDRERQDFNELLSGLLRKLGYGAEQASYDIGGLTLKGNADMLADDAVILFRPAAGLMENPKAGDLLYLNACLWMYEKTDGIIVYISGDRQESSFSLTRNKRMFEETVRRVRVLADLVGGDKAPILEPSSDCEDCQYYQRCYTKRKESKQLTLASMLGMSKGPD